MRAALASRHGGPEVVQVQDVEDPTPGRGEVLVRVEAAGIGPWDLYGLRGRSPVPVDLPFVPGGETVGEVVAVGEGVDEPEVGDRVMSAAFLGGLAELAVVHADAVGPAPTTLSAVDAASLPVDASTAHLALEVLEVAEGDVLVVAGAGTLVGHFAVQLAAGRGARVLATASPRNADRLQRMGAAVVVDYHGDWVEDLRPHGPADAVLDVAGGPTLGRAYELLRDGARAVTVVRSDVTDPPRGISVVEQHTHGERDRLAEVARLVDAGELVPLVAETLPLERAQEALARMTGAREPGKVVVRVRG